MVKAGICALFLESQHISCVALDKSRQPKPSDLGPSCCCSESGVCLFVCLAKRGFRSLIFDIQGVLINLWSVCLRSCSSVEFLESTGCQAGCLYVHLGVFSSQGWSGGDSSP